MKLSADHHGTVVLRIYDIADDIPPFIMGHDKKLAQPESVVIKWDWWTEGQQGGGHGPSAIVRGRKLKKDGTVGLQSVEYHLWNPLSSLHRQDALARGEDSLRRIVALVELYQPWAEQRIRAARKSWLGPDLILRNHW